MWVQILLHLVWPWASCSTSLSFCLLICEMRIKLALEAALNRDCGRQLVVLGAKTGTVAGVVIPGSGSPTVHRS